MTASLLLEIEPSHIAPSHGAPAPALRPPLLDRVDHASPSVFRPENMLREARRQKALRDAPVPAICLLDPDGDIVAHVKRAHGAARSPSWACFHTELWQWAEGGQAYGIVGCAVGGPFAVLVAEQLFACGCELLVSVASAGQIAADLGETCHILIERALRDEGTSHHYLPSTLYAAAEPGLYACALKAASGRAVRRGDTWTTDAPFRETADGIAARQADGVLAVEMEAASLYAFAEARSKPVICIAHVTNQLGRVEGDFEKGDLNGAAGSLDLARAIGAGWRRTEAGRRTDRAASPRLGVTP